jgi:Single-strand binding protein family
MRRRTRRRQERQRRQELEGIAAFGDVNELSISGHVEHEPRLRTDRDGMSVCEFVLTHTTSTPCGPWWEPQHYQIAAYGQIGEHYAASWKASEPVIVDGRLDYHVQNTLAGPVPSCSIVAHAIATLGPHPHPLSVACRELEG